MAETAPFLDPALEEYIRRYGARETKPQQGLRETSQQTLVNAQLAIQPDVAAFLAMQVKVSGAKTALEIGVYAGYSALVIAQSLPEDGRLIALERDARFPPIGQPYWREAGVDHKIDLRLCDAREEVEKLKAELGPDSLDFVFIDADKVAYEQYYEAALYLCRQGGLICLDNVLWYGRVIDETDQTRQTQAIRQINAHIHADERVDVSMVPIGDGMTLARKR